jgi:diguanylate cyclase (GGDEF)-like protein
MMGGDTVPKTEKKCSFCDIPESGGLRLFGSNTSFICEHCLAAFHRDLVKETPCRAETDEALAADGSSGRQAAAEYSASSPVPVITKSGGPEPAGNGAETLQDGAAPEIPDLSKIITDNTSGLYNLRYFQRQLEEMFREHEAAQMPLSLIMINIDHFRQINDAKGSAEGDKVLKESGGLFMSLVRGSGTVYRYGGDEFAILLRETDKRSAIEMAKQIREAFQFRFHGYVVKITVSVGVATYPDDGESGSDLLYTADKALYSSQRNGQNRVTAASSLRLF